MTTDGFFNFNNGNLYFQVIGQGEPVVFIHGFSLDHRMWRPQVHFIGQSYSTILYDVRGFGKSGIPIASYSHHEDLKALLDHLGVVDAHIVGLSMGGRIGLNFALSFPTMVRSLTLLGSALDGYASTVDWNVHAREVGIDKAKDNWLNHALFIPTKEHPDLILSIKEMVQSYSGWHWMNDNLEVPSSTNARSRLGELKIPVLIAVGQRDLQYFHDIGKVLSENIRNSHMIVIPNAGHMVNLENTEFCNTILLEHIRKCS